jgi:hypothetical protein
LAGNVIIDGGAPLERLNGLYDVKGLIRRELGFGQLEIVVNTIIARLNVRSAALEPMTCHVKGFLIDVGLNTRIATHIIIATCFRLFCSISVHVCPYMSISIDIFGSPDPSYFFVHFSRLELHLHSLLSFSPLFPFFLVQIFPRL